MTASSTNVVFSFKHLNALVRKSSHLIDNYVPPQDICLTLSPSSSLNSVVFMWVLRLCHAAVPPHSSLTSSWLKTVLTWEKEKLWGAENSRSDKQRDVKKGWPMWAHRCCDAMEMLVALTQTLHDNFELLYKHNMANVYRLRKLIAVCYSRG